MMMISNILNDILVEFTEKLIQKKTHISISKSILQICSGEDLYPQHVENEEYIACLVGDGHSGKGCKSILDYNAESILSAVLKEKNVDIGMKMCQDLCKNEDSGAMIAITMFNKNTRHLQIISVGDILVSVYKNGQIIHKQKKHDCQTIYESKQLLKELQKNKIKIDSPRLSMIPCIDDTMRLENRHSYFVWDNYQKIGASSFVGHRDMKRLSPFKSSLTLPTGQLHMVMASDGVADMIHPENELLCSFKTDASVISEGARKRWIDPHFNELPLEYDCYNVDGFFRPNQKTSSFFCRKKRVKSQTVCSDETVLVNFYDGSSLIVEKKEIIEHNSGADDICCLVLKFHD